MFEEGVGAGVLAPQLGERSNKRATSFQVKALPEDLSRPIFERNLRRRLTNPGSPGPGEGYDGKYVQQ